MRNVKFKSWLKTSVNANFTSNSIFQHHRHVPLYGSSDCCNGIETYSRYKYWIEKRTNGNKYLVHNMCHGCKYLRIQVKKCQHFRCTTKYLHGYRHIDTQSNTRIPHTRWLVFWWKTYNGWSVSRFKQFVTITCTPVQSTCIIASFFSRSLTLCTAHMFTMWKFNLLFILHGKFWISFWWWCSDK